MTCERDSIWDTAYRDGYARGKDKAHFEVREMVRDHDRARCGCEPCITIRTVLATYNVTSHN